MWQGFYESRVHVVVFIRAHVFSSAGRVDVLNGDLLHTHRRHFSTFSNIKQRVPFKGLKAKEWGNGNLNVTWSVFVSDSQNRSKKSRIKPVC